MGKYLSPLSSVLCWIRAGGLITPGALFLSALQMHIPGHAGYTGNEQADRLSREGAAKPLELSD